MQSRRRLPWSTHIGNHGFPDKSIQHSWSRTHSREALSNWKGSNFVASPRAYRYGQHDLSHALRSAGRCRRRRLQRCSSSSGRVERRNPERLIAALDKIESLKPWRLLRTQEPGRPIRRIYRRNTKSFATSTGSLPIPRPRRELVHQMLAIFRAP